MIPIIPIIPLYLYLHDYTYYTYRTDGFLLRGMFIARGLN